MILGAVGDFPGHRRTRAARLLPPPLLLRPLRRTPLLPRRLPPRLIVHRRRHRGVRAVPRRCPQRRLQLLPQLSDQRLQRGDLPSLRLKTRRLLPDQPITRIHGRLLQRVGHSPRSFLKRRTATTSTPHPPPKRNRRSPAAAVSRGPECSYDRSSRLQGPAPPGMDFRNRATSNFSPNIVSETGSTDFVEVLVRLQAEATGDDFLLDLGGAAEDRLDTTVREEDAAASGWPWDWLTGPT